MHVITYSTPSLTWSFLLSSASFQVVQVLRAIDRDEGGNESTVYFSIPPESSAALNFSVRDSGGRYSIFFSLSVSLLICFFFFSISLSDRLLSPTFTTLNPAVFFCLSQSLSFPPVFFSVPSPQAPCFSDAPISFSVYFSFFNYPSPWVFFYSPLFFVHSTCLNSRILSILSSILLH